MAEKKKKKKKPEQKGVSGYFKSKHKTIKEIDTILNSGKPKKKKKKKKY